MERTLILLKPDCVQRRLMGRVIARFEDKGLNIVAMKMMRVTPDLAKQHLRRSTSKKDCVSRRGGLSRAGRSWRPSSKVWKRSAWFARNARRDERAEGGCRARFAAIFSSSRQMNLVHGSDGPEAAGREGCGFYFREEEICE